MPLITPIAPIPDTAQERDLAPPSGLGAKIIRSVVFGGLRYILIAPIPFIMTPLVLHRVGVAAYGTWAVFLAMNGLTSLADLGLVGTLSKFIAHHHARGDFASLAKSLNSGLAMFLLLYVSVAATFFGLSPILAARLFHGSPLNAGELTFLLRCFAFVIAGNVLIQLFASITSGLQRLDITNAVSTVQLTLGAIFSAAWLLRGWGLRGLVYGYLVAGVIAIICYVLVVRALLPTITFNPFLFDRREARSMFDYSIRLYVTQAAVAVHNQIEKVLLSVLVGVTPTGQYEMASDAALKIRGCIGVILSPVLPAASELHARGDDKRMQELYYRAHKYLAFLGVPIVCYIVMFSHRLIVLWLGPGMTVIALPLDILLVANFINLATGPGFLIFAGCGYMKPGIQSAVFGLSINLVLSLVLIYKFGFTGAVIGTSVALVAAACYFIVAFHRKTGYPAARILKNAYSKPVIGSLLILLLLALIPARNLSWMGLVEVGLVFGALYVIVLVFARFFDEYDHSKIAGLASSIGLSVAGRQ